VLAGSYWSKKKGHTKIKPSTVYALPVYNMSLLTYVRSENVKLVLFFRKTLLALFLRAKCIRFWFMHSFKYTYEPKKNKRKETATKNMVVFCEERTKLWKTEHIPNHGRPSVRQARRKSKYVRVYVCARHLVTLTRSEWS
jgi:hypothetical protein